MTQAAPSEQSAYRQGFLRNVHDWLARGYAVLDAAAFASAEEEDITGELVRSMNDAAASLDAPAWMLHLTAQENVPLSQLGRLGKRRKRIDIELISTGRQPRPRFGIEAKRLHRSDSVSKYLGPDGLGCFLGSEYAAAQGEAGMLGYVQVREPAEWADKLANKLNEHQVYAMCPDGAWEPVSLCTALEHTYRSQHRREGAYELVTIYHTLLRFY